MHQLSPQETEALQALEESLWIPEKRFDNAYMEQLLHEDFLEFGRSGRIYSREVALAAPWQEIHATLPLKDLVVYSLSSDVAQVTYVSEVFDNNICEVGNRSSIWVKTSVGWQLRFHQGTAV